MADPIPTYRVNLNGSVAPQGMGQLMLTRGDSANVAVTLFDFSGTLLLDIEDLVDLTFEIYAEPNEEVLIGTPITLVAAELYPNLTLQEWTEEGGSHAVFPLTSAQTNYAFDTRQIIVWGVIYGTVSGGGRRTFGAGNIALRNGNATGPVPADVPPLFPTLSEVTAFLEAVNGFEGRLQDLEDIRVSPAITASSDARGRIGSFSLNEATGEFSVKYQNSPPRWITMAGFALPL